MDAHIAVCTCLLLTIANLGCYHHDEPATLEQDYEETGMMGTSEEAAASTGGDKDIDDTAETGIHLNLPSSRIGSAVFC